MLNPIRDSSNAVIVVTSWVGCTALRELDGFPLGTVGGSTTGEVAVKVITVGSATGTSSTTVQGTAADNAAAVGNPVFIGGRAVTGSTYAPAYTDNDVAQLAIDKTSGGLLCHTRLLTRAGDAIAADPKQNTGVPSNFTVATADGTVFTLAAGEKGFIQNLDSADPLAVKLGASASTSSFNFILQPGAAADDGKGGSVTIDDWVGVVSVATITGTARYIAWKVAA